MTRLALQFKKAYQFKQTALILYATAGDPSLSVTKEFLWYCQNAGVDAVELGIPFSDPLADGLVIQASSYRAVQKGISFKKVLDLVRVERKKGLHIPIVLMSSVTPILAYGIHDAAKLMNHSGIDGIILPDLPVDEDVLIRETFTRAGIDCIQMLTPTTTLNRRKLIIQQSQGFVYYVAVVGLTGKTNSSNVDLRANVKKCQTESNLPVCVGFGISTASNVKNVSQYARGVIVGSAIVENLKQYSPKTLSSVSKRFIDSLVKSTL